MITRLPQPLFDEVGVVAIVPDKWGPEWMDRHYVLNRLASYFHVVWMYQPGWRECLSALRTRGIKSTDSSARAAGLHVYRPQYWLPRFGRPAWLAESTSRQRLKNACDLLRAEGCTKLVLYLWRSEFAEALDLVPHDFSVYQVNDEYSFTPTEVPSFADGTSLVEVGRARSYSPPQRSWRNEAGSIQIRNLCRWEWIIGSSQRLCPSPRIFARSLIPASDIWDT